VRIAGLIRHPRDAWIQQVARNFDRQRRWLPVQQALDRRRATTMGSARPVPRISIEPPGRNSICPLEASGSTRKPLLAFQLIELVRANGGLEPPRG
jgi:hypothetical protein